MPYKILVIDDEPDLRTLVQLELEGEAFHVLTAHDGPSGLAAARRESPHLIILDLTMRGMDGYEVCDALKKDLSTRDIPIIMLTGRDPDEGLETALAKKVNWYTVKPFDMNDLIFHIEELLKMPHRHQAEAGKDYPSADSFL